MANASIEPERNVRRGVRLRQASFEDYQQIASLQSHYFLKVDSFEEWEHLWLDNPLYRELQSNWSTGWVVEDHNRKIIGSVENIPLLYEFDGNRVIAATGRALVVEPAYRSASLLLLDRLINQPDVDLYLNNTVNKYSMGLVDFFECKRVPVGRWDETAFWVTHYQECLEIFLLQKHCRLARPLSYPLSSIAFLVDRFLKRNLHGGNVQVEVSPGFDERFDDFWRDLRRNNPRRLLAVRTREVLQWHFRKAFLSNQIWIATVVNSDSSGGSLAAYAIFLRNDNPELGLRRMLLVDYQSIDGNTELLSPILCWALRRCRNERIHILDSVGRWLEKGELFETFAPHRRTLDSWTYFYRAADPALAGSLRNRDAWAPSLFDGDSSL
jgi:hypothetical protein